MQSVWTNYPEHLAMRGESNTNVFQGNVRMQMHSQRSNNTIIKFPSLYLTAPNNVNIENMKINAIPRGRHVISIKSRKACWT
jgi:hypothetical protein